MPLLGASCHLFPFLFCAVSLFLRSWTPFTHTIGPLAPTSVTFTVQWAWFLLFARASYPDRCFRGSSRLIADCLHCCWWSHCCASSSNSIIQQHYTGGGAPARAVWAPPAQALLLASACICLHYYWCFRLCWAGNTSTATSASGWCPNRSISRWV